MDASRQAWRWRARAPLGARRRGGAWDSSTREEALPPRCALQIPIDTDWCPIRGARYSRPAPRRPEEPTPALAGRWGAGLPAKAEGGDAAEGPLGGASWGSLDCLGGSCFSRHAPGAADRLGPVPHGHHGASSRDVCSTGSSGPQLHMGSGSMRPGVEQLAWRCSNLVELHIDNHNPALHFTIVITCRACCDAWP